MHVIIAGAHAVAFVSTHGEEWLHDWRSWSVRGDAFLDAWTKPSPLPAPLATRTLVRNGIVTTDGRILAPFQHFTDNDAMAVDPRCGVLMSSDAGRTWDRAGDVRLRPVQRHFGWTESNLVELSGSRVVMLVRLPGLMGLLYRADSSDGGRTWLANAKLMRAPSGGTPTLFSLGGDRVALIHNPNTRLALWISFDGMKTWPYQRALKTPPVPGPKEAMPHVHGFASADREWLHFSFIDSEQRVHCYSARLPPLK